MKRRSIFLIILICLVILYVIAHILANQKLNSWIEKQEYVTVEKAKLNLLMGNLNVKGAKISHEQYTTDTSTVEGIRVKGFSIVDYLLSDEINIDDIELRDAKLFLSQQAKSDTSNQRKRIFNISNINLESVDLSLQSDKFDLQAYLGSAYLSDLTNTDKFQFKDISFSLKDVSYKPKNGPHGFLTDKLELNSRDRQLLVDDFIIQPKCSVEEWPICHPNKQGRSTYKVGSIIGKLDTTKKLFSGVFLEELVLSEGLFELYSYQQMEPKDLPKTFFMEKFDGLDIPIDIPIIEVKNHTVRALLKADRVDTISFNQLYSTITNVTNIPEKVKANNVIKAKTLSKFMDTKLSVDFDFKIKDSLNTYAFKLDLEPMPFTKLNKALNYNTPFIIEDGLLQQLACAVNGNALTSNGECTVAYDDLSIVVENKKGKKKKFFTRVLNFIVKDGTSKTESIEPVSYRYALERDENKDFFFQAYTIILQIIRETMLPV